MNFKQYKCTECKNCGAISSDKDTKIIAAVQCDLCGKLHNSNSKTFIMVYGNLTQNKGK